MKSLCKLLDFVSVLMALWSVCSLSACGREAGPSAERKPRAAAAAATASAQEVGDAPRPEPSQAARAASEGEPSQAPAPQELAQVDATELLAGIRASGKKATLVNAWASWCGPCRREVPMLQALAVNLKPLGVEIVLVSVDELKDEPKARAFLRDNHVSLRSYLVRGSVADFKQGIEPKWPGMLPASFLFDGAGRLVHFWGGEAFESEIVPVVEGFLAGRSIPAETRYGLAPGKVEP